MKVAPQARSLSDFASKRGMGSPKEEARAAVALYIGTHAQLAKYGTLTAVTCYS